MASLMLLMCVQHSYNEYGLGPTDNYGSFKGVYGDYTTAMGAFGGNDTRCYNAQQLWITGWSKPFYSINISTILANSQIVYIPVQNRGPTGIKILINYLPFDIIVSYRNLILPYDKPFLNIGQGVGDIKGLAIHRSNSNIPGTDTILIGIINMSRNTFLDPQTNLYFILISFSDNFASIKICLYYCL